MALGGGVQVLGKVLFKHRRPGREPIEVRGRDPLIPAAPQHPQRQPVERDDDRFHKPIIAALLRRSKRALINRDAAMLSGAIERFPKAL
jgi:hypothetical protein